MALSSMPLCFQNLADTQDWLLLNISIWSVILSLPWFKCYNSCYSQCQVLLSLENISLEARLTHLRIPGYPWCPHDAAGDGDMLSNHPQDPAPLSLIGQPTSCPLRVFPVKNSWHTDRIQEKVKHKTERGMASECFKIKEKAKKQIENWAIYFKNSQIDEKMTLNHRNVKYGKSFNSLFIETDSESLYYLQLVLFLE